MKKFYEIMMNGEKQDAGSTVKRTALQEARQLAKENPGRCIEIYQVNEDDDYIPGTPIILVQDYGKSIDPKHKKPAATYICRIRSDASWEREYEVKTRSAYKCAMEFGRCEGGEVVEVYTKSGKLLSQARWSPEIGYYPAQI